MLNGQLHKKYPKHFFPMFLYKNDVIKSQLRELFIKRYVIKSKTNLHFHLNLKFQSETTR